MRRASRLAGCAVRALTSQTSRPLNLLTSPGIAPVAELAEMGVRRLSVGPKLAFAAMMAAKRVCAELFAQGTYTRLFDSELEYAAVNSFSHRRIRVRRADERPVFPSSIEINSELMASTNLRALTKGLLTDAELEPAAWLSEEDDGESDYGKPVALSKLGLSASPELVEYMKLAENATFRQAVGAILAKEAVREASARLDEEGHRDDPKLG
jgi:hypothetical protein